MRTHLTYHLFGIKALYCFLAIWIALYPLVIAYDYYNYFLSFLPSLSPVYTGFGLSIETHELRWGIVSERI
jgi:hypothetical protein